jgi:PKD repeat protein
MRSRHTLLCASIVALGFIALGIPSAALAAPPTNDNFTNATVISSLPFSDLVNNSEATTEPGEPFVCAGVQQTVWYAFTPSTSGYFRASLAGSTRQDGILLVFQQTGSDITGLSFIACSEPFFANSLTFTAQAGKTYYLQAGDLFGGFGSLQVNLAAVPPPPNDNFVNATPVTSVPFSDSIDTTAASVETGEPSLCTTPPPAQKTAWYRFTPTASGSVSASVSATFAPVAVAVYTGTSVGSLTPLACGYAQAVTIHVDAGRTYSFQVGSFGSQGGPLQFNLAVPPPPVAGMFFTPSDPSMFDTVQFYDQSFDPAQAGFSDGWDFGDGSTATGSSPTHRYTKDGSYSAKLTITTTDGRTASTSQAIAVATHDVAITKFSVPQAASSGQTRQITVGISDNRYPETVQVQLFKSTPGGPQIVGTLTQTVPVNSANRTTPFSFNYTFTGDDATVGKVTFSAIATIIGARDALPGDNNAIASPTTVQR